MKIRNIVAVCAVVACAAITGTACSNTLQNNNSGSNTSKTTGGEITIDGVDYGKVTLGQYKGIEIEVTDYTVTDGVIESRISTAVSMNPNRISVTDRDTVQNGDIININYEGRMDGETFEGGTSGPEGYDLIIGSQNFIPGFEDQVIGMKKGETKDINLVFPDPYPNNPDYANKPVVFTVTVNDIFKEEPAEFNDAWVERVTEGRQKTTDEYRKALREELVKYNEMMSNNEAQIAAINKVMEDSEFELSEAGINKEVETINKSLEQAAASYGMALAQFKEATGTTDESTRERAESFAKQRVVINTIFNNENMKIEDEDYKKIEEVEGKTKNELILEEGQEAVDEYVKSVKVVNFLVDNAVKKVKPAETEPSVTQETAAGTQSSEASEESSSN